ncbi:hypothetical protein BZL30_4856 [Mycobacterium kansasii]|uniref:Uncharacterized protein n=1 Tax=Mycobacterium kansasii TaxID=1768 RepID=A0A1V3X475_MYCKA|nr:hypothetical protein BZL30_4856 [Mycobacterium kansasii]
MRAEDTLRPGASENDNRTKFFRDPTRNYAGDLAGLTVKSAACWMHVLIPR